MDEFLWLFHFFSSSVYSDNSSLLLFTYLKPLVPFTSESTEVTKPILRYRMSSCEVGPTIVLVQSQKRLLVLPELQKCLVLGDCESRSSHTECLILADKGF